MSRPPVSPKSAVLVSLMLVSSALAAGCGGRAVLTHTPDVLRRHVVAMDSDGVARDPVDFAAGPIAPEAFAAQVKSVLDEMDAFHGRSDQAPKKVMIFVHGGLNNPDSALEAADGEIGRIEAAGYFPIFVNWQSDLIDSYGEHLVHVTQGRKEHSGSFGRALMTPLYLLADLGRAVTRAPLVWANQIGSDLTAARADARALTEHRRRTGRISQAEFDRWAEYAGADNTGEAYKELYLRFQREHAANPDPDAPRDEIQISIGPDNDVDEGRMFGLLVGYVLTSPVKFGTSWIIDGLGTSSWDNLTRRTYMVFEGRAGGNPIDPTLRGKVPAMATPPSTMTTATPGKDRRMYGRQRVVYLPVTRAATTQELAASEAPPPPDFDREGALNYFKNQFAERVKRHAPERAWEQYEITLVGHSMGSMVLNEWVRRNDEDGLFYKNIVYLAAACSVRDFQAKIVPYLRTHKNRQDMRGTTRFYNLTLHPTADLREKDRPLVGDLPARGSLLVWIDDFLANPATPLDRTLGRWDNIVQTAYVIPDDVKGQVTIKAMSLDPVDNSCNAAVVPDPQTHGKFRCYAYWDKRFWEAERPNEYQDRVAARQQAKQATHPPPTPEQRP